MDCTKEHIDQQRILSFCYGYGGLERGLQSVIPCRTVAYVEIEAFQNFNLVAAMEADLVDKAPIWTNLKTFDARPFRNRIHGIVGGYPCQGESLAGKRQLWNDNRFLWPYIERAVKAAQPLWVAFENVSGHISGSFPYVLDSLREMGYAVEAGLFTASEVGAPHKRERLFIFGIRKNTFDREFWECVANSKCSTGRHGQLCGNAAIGTSSADKSSNASGKDELGHTGSIERGLSQSIGRKEEAQTSGGGEGVLGYTTIIQPQRRGDFKGGQRKTNREEDKIKSIGSSHGMANTNNSGSRKNRQSTKLWSNRTKQSSCNSRQSSTGKDKEGGFYGWPSRPSEQQYEWEEKRTVKSGVGCTVNGYNFRTELLRQYGNGVVSQQAANAFGILIMKLLNDNNIL